MDSTDTSDPQMPDIESIDNPEDIFQALEDYQSTGGDIDALLETSDDAGEVPVPERPQKPDETVEDTDTEHADETEAEDGSGAQDPVPQQDTPSSTEPTPDPLPPPSDDTDPDPDLTERVPKPDFDPESLSDDARKVYEYGERVRRAQQSHYAKKINHIIGNDLKPEEAREALRQHRLLQNEPEFAAYRALVSGQTEVAPFVEALLNPNHPSHQTALQQYQRATQPPPQEPVYDPRYDDQLTNAVIDPETGDVDPQRVAALLTKVRANTLDEAKTTTHTQAPQEPPPHSFEGWAAKQSISSDDRLEMGAMWEAEGRPAFPDHRRVQYFEGLKQKIDAARQKEWEATRVKELEKHVTEATPKRQSTGAGMKGQKIDLEKYDDPVQIAEAIERGEIDLDDPANRRLANLD